MDITEVRIKLMEEPGERLKAFCSITFDDSFVVRDLKIIEGANGPFVAMPSRKLTARCPGCGSKNHLRAAFCNQCGMRLQEARTIRDEDGRTKLYADIAHPINSACREMIQGKVIASFEEEKARSKLPGYVPSYDDFEEETVAEARPEKPAAVAPAQVQPAHVQPAHVQPAQVQPAHVQPARVQPAQVQPAQVQPAEKPHGPHRPASQPVAQPAAQPARAAEKPKRDFGAGVFD